MILKNLIESDNARNLEDSVKWDLLSNYLSSYGNGAFSYATLQKGVEYFLTDVGYIAYTTVRHSVFAPRTKQIVLGDPVTSDENKTRITEEFIQRGFNPVLTVISEKCAESLKDLDFKVNCIGYEPEIPIQTYNTKGNWDELNYIRRARNMIKKNKIKIFESDPANIDLESLNHVSRLWLENKSLNTREIWFYARNPVYKEEKDVRKFFAQTNEGQLIGYSFYDPIYEAGNVIGYSANTVRCDEENFGRLSMAIHMHAIDKFRKEGKRTMNLCIAPFDKIDIGKFQDSKSLYYFIKLMRKYGDRVYNFGGLSFHKSRYKAKEKPVYLATKGIMPTNDLYLAFLCSGIAESYFDTLWKLTKGIFSFKK